MGRLITPDELPRWVPGELTLDSAPLGWPGVQLRWYRYGPSDVPVPALNTYTIVVYRDGATPMNRCSTGGWQREQVAPGCVSLLTRATQSHWRWSEDIEVAHLYLSPAAVADVAADVYGRPAREIELFDVLRADDPVLFGVASSLAREAREDGLGGRLYVEALKNQACVQLLRHYADVTFREPRAYGALSQRQCRLLARYIDENLGRNISLEDLVGVAQLSIFHLIRKFRNEFGCPPHGYVMRRRVERARRQLARRHIPLKVVVANCGFSDQSHMTRLFQRLLGTTPAAYRNSVTG